MTIARVGSIEQEVNQREKEIGRNERNIAVLLEKVTTVEQLEREIRQEIRGQPLGRADNRQIPP